ncbi:hypothetical protein ACVWXQ_001834 [Bradyrhizobium sp. S3.14.4]
MSTDEMIEAAAPGRLQRRFVLWVWHDRHLAHTHANT